MARLIWTDPALRSLEEIAEFIALDNPQAARRYVAHMFDAVGRLKDFPKSGAVPPELSDLSYRQVVVAPCRILNRFDGETVWIVHVFRGERLLGKQWGKSAP